MEAIDRLVFTFFNADVAAKYWPDILHGMGVTALLGLAIVAAGLALGLALAVWRSMAPRWIRILIEIYADIMRALPPLVIIIVLFFAFPSIGISLSSFAATWLALSLILGAYAEESIWSGLEAIPSGQREAARSTGMSTWQALCYIALPQALRMAVPPLTNRVISITKSTALGSVVALNEILNNAQSASSHAGNPTPLTLGALAYLVIFIPVVFVARLMESRQRWMK